MLIAKKYRIYPTIDQQDVMNRHFGGVRFVYNLALQTKNIVYASSGKSLSRYDLQVQMKDLKSECEWLKEINSQSLQVALMNLDGAYLRFFKGQAKFPRFKKKNDNQSFQCPQNFKIEDNKIFIPKMKTGIKIVLHRELKGDLRSATFSKTSSGKYFVSILTETNEVKPTLKPIKKETALGVDLGIKTFAVCSDGTEFENPKHLKNSSARLSVLQKRLSKKKKGSNNKGNYILVYTKSYI